MVRPISSPPHDLPADDRSAADLDGTLRAALIESRQRMKELLELSCDFAWETDANGLFSFVTSGGALGHETLDLLGSDPVDLVLSDVEMPGLDGEKLLQIKESRADVRDLPFLFLTGYGREALPRAFRESAVIEKPYTREQLVAAAGRMFESRSEVA